MKRICVFLLGIVYSLSLLSMNNVNNSVNNAPSTTCISEQSSEDDGWIYLGEVKLKSVLKNNKPNEIQTTLKAKLYVREIAKQLVYRVEYNGEFYPCIKSYPNDPHYQRYDVIIDDIMYHLNVPA